MNYNWLDSPLCQLLLGGKRLILPKGQVINALGDSTQIHFIKSGYIKRYLITKEGMKGIQVIYGPNDVFPLTPVFRTVYGLSFYSGPEHYYYESMTKIEIYSVEQAALQEALADNPLIYQDLFYAAGLRLNSYIHRLESMALRVANRKVAHQLVHFAEIFGKKDDKCITILVPLTHQSLADVLNLARETVTHCLIRLQEQGLIKIDKQITVLDIEKLKQAAH